MTLRQAQDGGTEKIGITFKLIAAFIKVNIRPGKREKLLEYLKWECQVARDEEPHVLRFDVFEDADDKSVIYYYEAYVDEAGFEKHKSYPPFQQWTNGLRDECVESTEGLLPVWSTAVCTIAEPARGWSENVISSKDVRRA